MAGIDTLAKRYHPLVIGGLLVLVAYFQGRGIAAWEDFVQSHKDRPYPQPIVGPEGEGADKQRELEERYFSDAAEKYRARASD